MLRNCMIAAVLIGAVISTNLLVRDFHSHWDVIKQGGRCPWPVQLIFSFILYVFSAFGISDFALSTAIYSKMNWVDIKKIPGTLNTQCALPAVLLALVYLKRVDLDPLTLIPFLVLQLLASFIGPRITKNIPAKALRYIIGVGLVISASFILLNKLNLLQFSNDALSLSGWRLILCWTIGFLLGIFRAMGIATYPLTMAMVFALGLNPLAAYPMMTGAAALLSPIVCRQFIKLDGYDKRATFCGSTAGIFGAALGLFLMNMINLSILQWIILAIIIYAAYDMFNKAIHTQDERKKVMRLHHL